MTAPGSALTAPRRRGSVLALLVLATAVLLAGCGLGGPGGNATLAYAIDQDDPGKPVLVAADGPIPVGQEFFVRLEINEIVETDHVIVRILNATGQGLREIDELRQPVEPPWKVAVIPITFREAGKWSLSMIVNTRKITDIEVETIRQ